MKTNTEHTDGYGMDPHCEHAADMIRELIGIEDCDVHMMKELEKDFFFYEWAPEKDGMIPIRLVTAWGTSREDVEAFLEKAGECLNH